LNCRESARSSGRGRLNCDNANRLTTIIRGSASVSFGYDNANRRTTLTLLNGVTVSYAYDSASHLTQFSYGTGKTGSVYIGRGGRY
jgi:YD repeat-containing protein